MTSPDVARLVLVADDEPQLLDLLRRMLSSAGFRVLTARDGAEALELALTRVGDLAVVVSDIEMPKMSGLELRDALQATVPSLPVLLMSGSTMASANAPSVLRKPFESAELLDRVYEAVERGRHSAAAASERSVSGSR